MRLALLALVLSALAATPAQATNCAWTVTANISPPDQKNDIDSGSGFNSFWTWQYVIYANHLTIFGQMSAYTYHATTNLSSAATGNGTYTVARIIACRRPVEDIEGDARNEFTARAEIDDDSFARARGSQRIQASKMSLDCHACGGVEATAAGYGGDEPGGTVTIPLYPQGPNMVLHWSKGGAIEQAFQDSDGGEGGRTPETIFCQTNLDLSLSVGWWEDEGLAVIKKSKSQLNVYGTCDGACAVVTQVIQLSVGY